MWPIKHYWRVWAWNAASDLWCTMPTAWSFINGGVSPPSAPSGLRPTIPGTSITFNWSAVTGADSYWLQVNSSSDWLGTNRINEDVGNVLTRAASGFANDGSTWYWRARAHNAGGWSDWSSSQNFINGP